MENSPPPLPSILDIPPPPPGIFGSKIPSGVTFAVGILLFLLPFAEIKCNNSSLMQNSGLGIAMGSNWKISPNSLLGNDMFAGENNQRMKDQKNEANFYAIVALALAAIGLLLSLLNARAAAGTAMVSGVLSAIALIGLWIDLKRKVNDSIADTEKAGDMIGMGKMKISLELTPWFFLALVAFLAAAFFCYRRLQVSK